MNNFEFIIKIESDEKENLKERMHRLIESVSGYEPLSEIDEFNLDTDSHYLGLLSVVLCGKEAVNWYEDAGRAFIDGMNIKDDYTELYVRVNYPDKDFLQKIIDNSELKTLNIEMFVNKEDESTLYEFGENFIIEVSK